MIPNAAELKEEISFRRSIEIVSVNAPNPESVEIQIAVLLDQIESELETARRESHASRTSVSVSFNSREKYLPALNLLRLFLIARGYTPVITADRITISWT